MYFIQVRYFRLPIFATTLFKTWFHITVNAYHLISRFTLYFKNINPSMTREYGNKSETEISTTDQVYHAARGLAYIQDYYNLNITEFSQGTYFPPISSKNTN